MHYFRHYFRRRKLIWPRLIISGVATFDMSSRAQFLRLGNETSAVFSRVQHLGPSQKIPEDADDLWNLISEFIRKRRNEISEIVRIFRYFLRRSENSHAREHRRSLVAESQKLSSGAHVNGRHTRNDWNQAFMLSKKTGFIDKVNFGAVTIRKTRKISPKIAQTIYALLVLFGPDSA